MLKMSEGLKRDLNCDNLACIARRVDIGWNYSYYR